MNYRQGMIKIGWDAVVTLKQNAASGPPLILSPYSLILRPFSFQDFDFACHRSSTCEFGGVFVIVTHVTLSVLRMNDLKLRGSR
jgi:hypothetical protein